MKQSGVCLFKLAFEHIENILNTYLNMFDFCALIIMFRLAHIGHFMYWGDLAKHDVTFEDGVRFY